MKKESKRLHFKKVRVFSEKEDGKNEFSAKRRGLIREKQNTLPQRRPNMFRESKRHVQLVLISNINNLSAKQKKRFPVPEKESTVPCNGTNDPSEDGICCHDQYAEDTQL
jgi:hypothetical protein